MTRQRQDRRRLRPASGRNTELPSIQGGDASRKVRARWARDLRCPGLPLRSAVRKEDAGHQHRIHTVIAAPGLAVILNTCALGYLPHGRIPRYSISVAVSDNHVGRCCDIRSFVKIVGRVDGSDWIAFTILQRGELGESVRFQFFGFLSRRNGAAGLRALQVDVKPPARPHTLLSGSNRLHGESALVRSVFQCQISVITQPTVQVDAAPERAEAMIGRSTNRAVVSSA